MTKRNTEVRATCTAITAGRDCAERIFRTLRIGITRQSLRTLEIASTPPLQMDVGEAEAVGTQVEIAVIKTDATISSWTTALLAVALCQGQFGKD